MYSYIDRRGNNGEGRGQLNDESQQRNQSGNLASMQAATAGFLHRTVDNSIQPTQSPQGSPLTQLSQYQLDQSLTTMVPRTQQNMNSDYTVNEGHQESSLLAALSALNNAGYSVGSMLHSLGLQKLLNQQKESNFATAKMVAEQNQRIQEESAQQTQQSALLVLLAGLSQNQNQGLPAAATVIGANNAVLPTNKRTYSELTAENLASRQFEQAQKTTRASAIPKMLKNRTKDTTVRCRCRGMPADHTPEVRAPPPKSIFCFHLLDYFLTLTRTPCTYYRRPIL